ncbi:MAG: MotA/TolQ/ExbB proton channel family protein [Verrucomicrobia bacterium]|nr:MotA/TolQ/ExbB proton channel family protein [Verrucomicrobiota bacterium]
MMLIIGMCLFAAMTVDRAHSQSLSSAFTQGTSALQSAQEELAALRNQITQEKIPMSSELRAEEAKVLTMRREVERMQRMNDTRGLDLRNLEVQLKSRTDELQYVSTLLTDYVNRLNSELNPSEFGVYGDKLLEIINITDDPNISKEQIFQSQLGGISLGLERMKDIVGGKRFPGKAVLPDGKLGEGSFAMVGPLVYFASADGKFAGLAERGPSLEPRLVQFDDTAISSIAEVISSGKGEIPMDLTLGKAAAIATTKETVVEHILKGGIWMGPILLFAVVSLILGVYKAVEMKTVRKLAPGVLSKVLTLVREDNNEEAKEFLKQHKGPASDMLQDALKSVHLPKELLEEFMFENILSIQPKLERGLAIISTTAAVAPLLGLLGTVTGMINTFKLITLFGTGDARSLSSGISEALITTEFGLIVAIPALLLSAYLSRKSSGILADMERVSISFVNGVVAIKNPSPYSVREKEAFSK